MKLSNVFSKRNRVLLRELVVTDFKLRYQGSALGYLWSILKPLFLFAILYIVFDQFLRLGRDIQYFPVYLLLGIVLWTFFTEATNNGLQSIISRGDLIRKINFPKYIIVISGTISSLINMGINLIVVGVFMAIQGVPVTLEVLWLVPLIAELYIFALGLAFLLAALNVKFRDIGYLWEVFLQAAFYATPILYPLAMVMEHSDVAAKIIMLSPVAQVIQDARHAVVTQDTITGGQLYSHWYVVVIPFIIVGVTIIVGGLYFKKRSSQFAENI
jgi:ABC-2 type transport system permease protein